MDKLERLNRARELAKGIGDQLLTMGLDMVVSDLSGPDHVLNTGLSDHDMAVELLKKALAKLEETLKAEGLI